MYHVFSSLIQKLQGGSYGQMYQLYFKLKTNPDSLRSESNDVKEYLAKVCNIVADSDWTTAKWIDFWTLKDGFNLDQTTRRRNMLHILETFIKNGVSYYDPLGVRGL